MKTIIIPLLTSMNSNKMKPLIDECMEYARQNLTGMKLKKDTDTINTLMTLLETSELTRMEWVNQWFDLITGMFQESYKDISELDKAVANSGKKDCVCCRRCGRCLCRFTDKKDDRWKMLLKALCQNVVNELQRLDYGKIGIVVFARKDMINNAIDTNTEQFRSMYYNYELNWTQTEALRLALWIASKAYPGFGGWDGCFKCYEICSGR